MATVNSNTITLSLSSRYGCKWGDDGHNYLVNGAAPSTDTQYANFNNPVPAGGTITAMRLVTTWSYTGGVNKAQVNGSALAAGTDTRNVSGFSHSYTWRCVQTCGAYQREGYYTKTMSVSAYMSIDYTPATAPTITKVYVNSSTAAQYKSGGQGVTISWSASNGTNNAISSYNLYYSDNDGAWTYLANTTAKSYTSSAHPNPGVKRRFSVIAVAPYGNSARVAGPYVYTYSAPSVSGVLINGSASTAYAGAEGALTLSWSAANGSYNAITSYNIYISDNGGAWYLHKSTTAKSYAVNAHSTAGSNRRFSIIAVAPYGNSAQIAGPYVYSYSAVGAPTTVSISPTSIYTNSSNPSLSWSGASNGTGVSISTYHIYQNGDKIGEKTASPFSVPTPTTPGTYNYTVYAIGSVSGYNSGASPAATLTTINPSSPFSLSSTGSDMNDVNTVTCTISPVDSSYTHTVTWKINGVTKVDKYDVGASSGNITHDFTLLEDYCADLTDAKSMAAGGSCTIETKIGTNVVSETKTFAISVPDSIKPTALATLTSIYKIGEEYFCLRSTNGCKVTGSGISNYGSPIVKYQFELLFEGTSLGISSNSATDTWTTPTSSNVGTHTIKTTVTDARGQTGTRSDTFTIKDYNKPSLAPSYYRVSLVGGNWVKDDDGETLHINPAATPYVVKNSDGVDVNSIVSATIRYKEKGASTWSEMTTIVNDIANIIYQDLLAMSDNYDLEVTVKDTFNLSTTSNYTLSSAQRMFDFRNDRAAFGRVAGEAKTFILPDDWTTNLDADKLDGYHASNAAGDIPISNGEVNTNLNVDKLDGYHASNSDGDIPVNNGVLNTNLNADKLDGYHAGDLMFGNPNILHNWDFRNPVNQRGLSTASGRGYWLDRWRLNNTDGATYTYSSSWGLRAITTINNITMQQYIENPNAYAGKTVTLSVDVYSASLTASCTVRLWYNGETQIGSYLIIDNGDTGIKSMTATIPVTALTNLAVVFYNYAGNDVRIKSIKLELGTVSTLHLDPPMDHAVELLKCKRYFEILVGVLGQGIITTRVSAPLYTVEKRIAPTITVRNMAGGLNSISLYNSSTTVYAVSSIGGGTASSIFFISMTDPVSVGGWYRFSLLISADL